MSAFQSEVLPRGVEGDTRTLPSNWLATGAFYLLMISMSLSPWMADKERATYTGDGNASRQIMYLCVLVGAIVARKYAPEWKRSFAIPASMLVVLAYCWVTLLWSADADVGARRLVLTTIIIVSTFLLTSMLGYQKTVDVIRNVLVVVLMVNFVTVILFPTVGIHRAAQVAGFGMDPELIGSWKGMLAHKNIAGAYTAVTILFFLLDAKNIKPLIRYGVLLAATVFLIKTQSKTSLAIAIGAVLVGFAYTFYDHYYRKLVISGILLFLAAAGLFVYVDWDAISKPLQRPDALTGRVQIWRILFAFWRDHPWGAGYGSVWNVGASKPIDHYLDHSKQWIALVAEAHNGYIDMLVQIGMVGLILAVIALVILPLGKLLIWRTDTRSQGALLAAILFFCIGHNFCESSFMDRDTTVQIFAVLTIALIERTTAAARQAGRSEAST